MPDYRFYVIDQEGRFSRALNIECDSNSEAKAHARTRAGADALELWSGDRLVATLGTVHVPSHRAPDQPTA